MEWENFKSYSNQVKEQLKPKIIALSELYNILPHTIEIMQKHYNLHVFGINAQYINNYPYAPNEIDYDHIVIIGDLEEIKTYIIQDLYKFPDKLTDTEYLGNITKKFIREEFKNEKRKKILSDLSKTLRDNNMEEIMDDIMLSILLRNLYYLSRYINKVLEVKTVGELIDIQDGVHKQIEYHGKSYYVCEVDKP